jgi:hypothetical protein
MEHFRILISVEHIEFRYLRRDVVLGLEERGRTERSSCGEARMLFRDRSQGAQSNLQL